MRGLLKKPVFLKRDGNWFVVLPTKTKKNNNKIQSSIKIANTMQFKKR